MRVPAAVSAVYAILAIGCAAISTEPLPAPAAPAAAPHLIPGDRWEWTTYAERFLREEGDLLVFEASTPGGYRATRYRTKDLNLVKDVPVQEGEGTSNVRDPHSGYLRFPLHVGARWEHTYKNIPLSGDVIRNARYEAVAYEKIAVRGRTYAAYRIEGIDQRSDRPFGIRITIWYAPDVKNWIKFLGINDYDNQVIPGFDFELVSYKPAS